MEDYGPKDQLDEEFNQLLAIHSGLNTRSANRFYAAVYINAELTDFPRQADDFEYHFGRGMYSSLLGRRHVAVSRTALFNHAEDYTDYEKEVRTGEILSEYDNLDKIALYLFKDHAEEDDISPGGHKLVMQFEDYSTELDSQIEEISRRLN